MRVRDVMTVPGHHQGEMTTPTTRITLVPVDGREAGMNTASRMEALSTGDQIEERGQEIDAGGKSEPCIATHSVVTLHTDCIRFSPTWTAGRERRTRKEGSGLHVMCMLEGN